MKQYYLYILSNPNHSVLYTGMTANLHERIYQHKQKVLNGFASKYNCTKLLYYEAGEDFYAVANRERQVKRYKRKWKENLINTLNPSWKDLSEDFEF